MEITTMSTPPDRRFVCVGIILLVLGLTLIVSWEVVPAYAQAPEAASTAVTVPRPPHPPKLPIDRSVPALKFAFISYANPQQVARDIKPIVKYLEPCVGVPIKGFVTLDYGSAIEAMRSGKVDLATIDPLAFMMAHEQIGATPLALEVYSTGRASYHSNVWVRRDSGLKAAADLKGRTIAFADQVDMSGHLLPREIFIDQGLMSRKELSGGFFKQVYFAGGDEQAIRAVMNRHVDAAGISQYAYLLLRPEERDVVTTIARSIESPAHLIMARKGLSKQVCQRLKQALLALDHTQPADKVILDKLYGVQGFVAAKLSDFEDVAKVAGNYGFVKKPQLFAADKEKPKHAPAATTKADSKPVNANCPIDAKPVDATVTLIHNATRYGFCSNDCRRAFQKNPQAGIARLQRQQ
jgi:phosphonate transport system substrate-binding protein